jgi:hypothetical protein
MKLQYNNQFFNQHIDTHTHICIYSSCFAKIKNIKLTTVVLVSPVEHPRDIFLGRIVQAQIVQFGIRSTAKDLLFWVIALVDANVSQTSVIGSLNLPGR